MTRAMIVFSILAGLMMLGAMLSACAPGGPDWADDLWKRSAETKGNGDGGGNGGDGSAK